MVSNAPLRQVQYKVAPVGKEKSKRVRVFLLPEKVTDGLHTADTSFKAHLTPKADGRKSGKCRLMLLIFAASYG